jgi:hypothetical protein
VLVNRERRIPGTLRSLPTGSPIELSGRTGGNDKGVMGCRSKHPQRLPLCGRVDVWRSILAVRSPRWPSFYQIEKLVSTWSSK